MLGRPERLFKDIAELFADRGCDADELQRIASIRPGGHEQCAFGSDRFVQEFDSASAVEEHRTVVEYELRRLYHRVERTDEFLLQVRSRSTDSSKAAFVSTPARLSTVVCPRAPATYRSIAVRQSA
jgi:hypothetical protein